MYDSTSWVTTEANPHDVFGTVEPINVNTPNTHQSALKPWLAGAFTFDLDSPPLTSKSSTLPQAPRLSSTLSSSKSAAVQPPNFGTIVKHAPSSFRLGKLAIDGRSQELNRMEALEKRVDNILLGKEKSVPVQRLEAEVAKREEVEQMLLERIRLLEERLVGSDGTKIKPENVKDSRRSRGTSLVTKEPLPAEKPFVKILSVSSCSNYCRLDSS